MSRSPYTFTGTGVGILAALVIPIGLGMLASTKAFESWLLHQPDWLQVVVVISYWLAVLGSPFPVGRFVSRRMNDVVARQSGRAGPLGSTAAIVGWLVLAAAVIIVVTVGIAIYLAYIALAFMIGVLVLIGVSSN